MFVCMMVMMLLGVLSFIIYSEHPVSVGLWFMFYSLMVTVLVGLEWSSYAGYLMFFVYVGALLVMFCMVVSLTPNPVFRVVPFISLFPLGGSLVTGIEFNLSGAYVEEVVEGVIYDSLGMHDSVGWGMIMLWLGLIFLLSMISVVSLCKWLEGPLIRFGYKGYEAYENFFSKDW